MKATNYQKQTLKMYGIKFNKNISFQDAEHKIKRAEKRKKEQFEYNIKSNGNLEGSN